MTDVVISLANGEDIDRLAEVEIKAFDCDKDSVIWKLMYPPNQRLSMEDRIKNRAQSGFDLEARCFVKATVKDSIVGYAEWVPPGCDDTSVNITGTSFTDRFKSQVNNTRRNYLGSERYWYLAMLVVDPTCSKMGVGRHLLQWGMNRAKEEKSGQVPCFLEASVIAERFYQKFGFETVAWDHVVDKEAPDGICKWPYMIKRVERET